MQENVIKQNQLLRDAFGRLQLLEIVIARPAMQLGIPIGIAPAHIREKRFTREIVGEQAFGARF